MSISIAILKKFLYNICVWILIFILRGFPFMRYKTLLFDADGTLLDFERSEHEAIGETLRHFELPDSEDIRRTYSIANAEQWRLLEERLTTKDRLKADRFRVFCERIGVVRPAEEMARFYESRLATKNYLLEDALAVCERLSKTHSLYIITNGIQAVQEGRFSNSPLTPLFQRLFISESVGAEKPSVEYFRYVADHIDGFSPRDALVIGDSLSSDIAGGIAAGIDVCWFNPQNKPAPDKYSINYTISKLSELEAIV